MESNYIFEGLKSFTIWLIWLYLLGLLVRILINSFIKFGKDDSDPEKGRSNLVVLTDHKTGLQYLSAAKGGLIPRLDNNGNQIVQAKK